jgi:hypothetical protein
MWLIRWNVVILSSLLNDASARSGMETARL